MGDVIQHIDIEQSASGLTSTHEKRCLDDVFREHSDWLFGTVKGKTKWVTLDEVTDEFLKGLGGARGRQVPEEPRREPGQGLDRPADLGLPAGRRAEEVLPQRPGH